MIQDTRMLAILALLGAIIFGVLLFTCNQSKDGYNFCGTCRNVDSQVCPQRKEIQQLYQNGDWTENSEMIRPGGWTQWAWDVPASRNINSSMLRAPPTNNPNLVNYNDMLYPTCTGEGLAKELYQHPESNPESNPSAVDTLCGHQWPTGSGSCPCQTPNSMCRNPFCHKYAPHCNQFAQGLNSSVQCP